MSQSRQMAEQEFQSGSGPRHPYNLGEAHTRLRKFREFPNTGTHIKTTHILTCPQGHTQMYSELHARSHCSQETRVSAVVLLRGYPQLFRG